MKYTFTTWLTSGIILIPMAVLVSVLMGSGQFQLQIMSLIVISLTMLIQTATLVKSAQATEVQILFQSTKQVQEAERDLVLFQQSGVKDKQKENDLVNLMMNSVELGLFSLRKLDVPERDESLAYFDGLLLNWKNYIQENPKILDDPSAFKEVKKRLNLIPQGEKMDKPKSEDIREGDKRDTALNLLALFLSAILILFSKDNHDDKMFIYFFTFSFILLFYFIYQVKNKQAILNLSWVLKKLTLILALVFLSLTIAFFTNFQDAVLVPIFSISGIAFSVAFIFIILVTLIFLVLDVAAALVLWGNRDKLVLFDKLSEIWK